MHVPGVDGGQSPKPEMVRCAQLRGRAMGRAADPERLRLSLQLALDFVLDGLWQGFRVPTFGYVDGHTLRVQQVAMIVVLGGKVLHGDRRDLTQYRP